MKEKELIQIIKSTLNSKYIGDDCAYLKDLGIVITQDSLVEDVHFSLKYTSPFQLGLKSVTVNISDICASGAKPLYLTISLSLPKYIDEEFVKSFYEGAKEACEDVEIVGGDITGGDKLFISVCAIGTIYDYGHFEPHEQEEKAMLHQFCAKGEKSPKVRRISSRASAKTGYKVIVSGEHGNSAKGLELLSSQSSLRGAAHAAMSEGSENNFPSPLKGESLKEGEKFIRAHLTPKAQRDFSKQIAQNADCDYAMTDTSDGLADALMQIAKASGVTICVDTSKIPHDPRVDMNMVLYGGEDYQLIAAVPESLLKKIHDYTIIGEVKDGTAGINIDGTFYSDIEDKIYNHFGRNK